MLVFMSTTVSPSMTRTGSETTLGGSPAWADRASAARTAIVGKRGVSALGRGRAGQLFIRACKAIQAQDAHDARLREPANFQAES